MVKLLPKKNNNNKQNTENGFFFCLNKNVGSPPPPSPFIVHFFLLTVIFNVMEYFFKKIAYVHLRERKFYVAKADSEINFRKAKIYFERSGLTAKLSPLIGKVLFNVKKVKIQVRNQNRDWCRRSQYLSYKSQEKPI